MKKTYLLFALLCSFLGFSQYNESAPWMNRKQNDKSGAPKIEKTIDELVIPFNEYWKTHNKNKKASGHKPFMRWRNHWENLTNDQGYLIKPQEMWTAFEQKKLAKSNKGPNSTQGLPPSNWTPVGPFTHINTGSWSSGQGRVGIVCADPSNPNTIYVGSPAGGIWKSTDAGQNWIPLADNLPQI